MDRLDNLGRRLGEAAVYGRCRHRRFRPFGRHPAKSRGVATRECTLARVGAVRKLSPRSERPLVVEMERTPSPSPTTRFPFRKNLAFARRDRKFESISLQQRVSSFRCPVRKGLTGSPSARTLSRNHNTRRCAYLDAGAPVKGNGFEPSVPRCACTAGVEVV